MSQEKQIKKLKIRILILKITSWLIALRGIIVFVEQQLWRADYSSNDYYSQYQVYFPIIVIGFSLGLYGIAWILEQNINKKIKNS